MDFDTASLQTTPGTKVLLGPPLQIVQSQPHCTLTFQHLLLTLTGRHATIARRSINQSAVASPSPASTVTTACLDYSRLAPLSGAPPGCPARPCHNWECHHYFAISVM
jgi:hypothetical protein